MIKEQGVTCSAHQKDETCVQECNPKTRREETTKDNIKLGMKIGT